MRVTVGSADSEDGVTFTYRGLGSVAKHLARALETGDAPSILMLARELSLPELAQCACTLLTPPQEPEPEWLVELYAALCALCKRAAEDGDAAVLVGPAAFSPRTSGGEAAAAATGVVAAG